MDEERTTARPSTEEQDRTETTTDTPDPSIPDTTPNGGWAFVTQTHYDPTESQDLTTVIITAIADAEDTPIVEIKEPPLYEVVDTAGIHAALFGRPAADDEGTTSSVEFRYNQYKVSVAADGWVTVTEHTTESASDST